LDDSISFGIPPIQALKWVKEKKHTRIKSIRKLDIAFSKNDYNGFTMASYL
jgi:hypothetical protein